MTVVVIGSTHGAPGATTLALDLAQLDAGRALLIEADPDGGCLAARLAIAIRPGLTELAGAARTGLAADDLWRFAQPSPGGAALVVAHPAAEQVQAALRAAVQHIGRAARDLGQLSGRHVLIDVGRIRPGSPAAGLLAVADHVVVLAANSVDSAVTLTHRAQLLRPLCNPIVVLSSDRPYSNHDIEAACGLRVWHVVPTGRRRRDIRRRIRSLQRLHDHLFPRQSPGATTAPAARPIAETEPTR